MYVAKRPYVDEFMKRMGELFEVVVFTASLSKVSIPPLPALFSAPSFVLLFVASLSVLDIVSMRILCWIC